MLIQAVTFRKTGEQTDRESTLKFATVIIVVVLVIILLVQLLCWQCKKHGLNILLTLEFSRFHCHFYRPILPYSTAASAAGGASWILCWLGFWNLKAGGSSPDGVFYVDVALSKCWWYYFTTYAACNTNSLTWVSCCSCLYIIKHFKDTHIHTSADCIGGVHKVAWTWCPFYMIQNLQYNW